MVKGRLKQKASGIDSLRKEKPFHHLSMHLLCEGNYQQEESH
jgi:hypothetical protein